MKNAQEQLKLFDLSTFKGICKRLGWIVGGLFIIHEDDIRTRRETTGLLVLSAQHQRRAIDGVLKGL